jgi:prepilin-type N-terminal cleavage/methylation domain-containing protein
MKNESGFSLIELLTVMATIGVLAGISMQTYNTYRVSAFDTHATELIIQAVNALEAGKVEASEYTDGGYWVSSQVDGSFSGWFWHPDGGAALDGSTIIPGLKATPETRVSVTHDPWCNSGNIVSWGGDPNDIICVTDWISAYHCKGSTQKSWQRWNNGLVQEFEFNSPGC